MTTHGLLPASLGAAWRDEWLAQGLPGVDRAMLPAVFSSDPDAALQDMAEQVLAATPADGPERPGYLNNLGTGLRARYALSGQLADLEAARQSFGRACALGLQASLEEALRSARNWGNWVLERRDWQEATEAYAYGRQAIDLLFAAQTGARPRKRG